MRLAHIDTPSRIRLLPGVLFLSLTFLLALSVPVVLGLDPPGDEALLRLALLTRSSALTTLVQVLTFFGSAAPAFALCVILSGVELGMRMRDDSNGRHAAGGPAGRRHFWRQVISSAWPTLAFVGMLTCNILLRVTIARIPLQVDVIPNLLPEIQADFQRYSYPSGHAGAITVAYAALAIVAWRNRPSHSRVRWVALACASVLIVGVGFGRVYLGVHWPSDVVAGYLLGAVWLSVALTVCRDRNVNQE